MKKIPILVVLLLIGGMVLSASPVDTNMVKTVALNFFQSQASQGAQHQSVQPEVQIVYTHPFAREMNATHADALYVCNIGQNGFVVVSSDNRVEPVLGYSLTESFDVTNIPPAMLWLFDDYAWQIAGLDQSETEIPEHTQWELLLSGSLGQQNSGNNGVGPLLKTKWNQGTYYNLWCPYKCAEGNTGSSHVWAGCVAVAMAQLIHYWYFDQNVSGTGYHANASLLKPYLCETYPMSANFGSTTYHHPQMPNSLSASTNNIGKQEVAKFLYHCGTAIDMEYDTSGSSAPNLNVYHALQNYFVLDSVTILSKINWSNPSLSWSNMLKQHLDLLRPIYYSGSSIHYNSTTHKYDTVGHAFVLDGYRASDGKFRVNWGWGGHHDNEFFTIDLLNPFVNGYVHNYDHWQQAIIAYNVVPLISIQESDLTFTTKNSRPSNSIAISVMNQNMSHNISVTATPPFEVSTSPLSSTFGPSASLSPGNSTLYVRYNPPVAFQTQSHTGNVTVSYDALVHQINLTGYNVVQKRTKPRNPKAKEVYPNNIILSWDKPDVLVPSKDTMSMGTNWSTTYKYRNSSYKISTLHRLTAEDLIDKASLWLTKVSFIAQAGASNYKIVVYKGGSVHDHAVTPGYLVVEQAVDVNSLVMNSWNTITLNNPVEVELDKELWIGVYLESDGTQYVIPVGDSVNYVLEKGDLFVAQEDDQSWSWGFFGINANFCLQYHFESSPMDLIHYDIYKNEGYLASTTDTFYVDTLYQDALYNYRVNAVYADSTEADTTISVFYEVPLAADTVHATFCQNNTYDFFGTMLDQAGEYSHNANHLYTVLYLDALPVSESYDTLTLCTCDLPYTWNTLQITAAGDYIDTLVAANGCDSIVHLNVTTVAPQLYVDEKPLSFVAYDTAVSKAKPVVVRGNAYALGTSVTVSSPFEVSSDSVSFGSSLTLSPSDTTVYVRYRPLQAGENYSDTAHLTVSFDSIQKQVPLRGYHITTVYPAPENLQYTMIFPDTVHLTWQTPVALSQTSKTLSIDSLWNWYAYGWNNQNYKVSCLHRYCEEDLQDVSPSHLTGVSFIPKGDATLYRVVAYKGGSYRDSVLTPGALVASKDVNMSSLTFDTWNTINLDVPIPVEADEELWVGVYVEAPAGTYTITVGDIANYIPEKGDVECFHSANGYDYWRFFGVGRNFTLKAEFQLQPPALQHYDVYQNDSLMASVGLETEYKFKMQEQECDYRVAAVYEGQKSASDSVHFLMVPEIVVDTSALEHLVMISVDNNPSEPVSIDVFGFGTSHPLNMSVTGPFEVGYDTASFDQLLAFPNDSTHLLIRYAPVPTAKSYCEYGSLSIMYDTLSVDVPLKGYRITKDYPAPENLHHTHILPDTVELAWQEPPLVTNHYAAYDTNWASSYMYLNGDYKVAMLNRYCDTDLVHFYPGKLSHIKFIAPTGITQCHAVVYQGGRVVDGVLTPGTQIVNQTVNVSSLNMNQWNVVTLNEPITVDLSQELWFGIYIEADSGYYTMAVGDSTTYVPGKGNVEALYLPNGTVYWRFFNHNVNFLITGVFQSDPLELSHYRVQRGDSVLCTTTLTDHNDVVPAPGTYLYSVTAVYSDGGEGQATINPYINAPLYYDTVNAVICANETYNFFNTHLQQPGRYHHFANQTWSVLDLAVMEVPEVTISASALYLPNPGDVTLTAGGADSYVWNTGLTTSVIYVHPETTTLYSVTGTSSSTGCSNSASVTIVVDNVGVDEFSSSNISIYPNPVHDRFTVKGEFDDLILHDVWGRPVLKESLMDGDNLEISVSDLAAGTYILYVIKQGVVVHTSKVVVL